MRDVVESHDHDMDADLNRNMQESPNMNAYLDNDALYYIVKNHPFVWKPLSQTASFTRAIALRCFIEADHIIMRAFPSFLPGMDATQITNENAIKIFKRLINNLHDEAQRLNGDKPYPTTDPSLDRMTWECVHYSEFTNEVQLQAETVKARDFKNFVEAVAKQIGIPLPQELDPRKFWHDVLKDDPRILQITNLNLSNQKYKFLPEEIASLSNLQQLELQGNQLKELSPLFASLSKLEYLDLSSNPLGKIPQEITALSSLKHLYLNKAKITELPNDLTTLSSLQEIYLSNNQLKEIPPQAITSLSNLRKLFLYENPLTLDCENNLIKIQSVSKNLSIQFDNHSPLTRSGLLWNES